MVSVKKTDKGRSAGAGDVVDAGIEPAPTARRELVENQIFEHAIALFAERGFAGTSLQDIAAATGLTRPALYYYVKSKNDLLGTLVRQATDDMADDLEQLASGPGSNPVSRLRSMVFDSAMRQASDPRRFRLMVRSEAELPEELYAQYHHGRRRILSIYTTLIDEGIMSGHFRPTDSRIAALGIIGMFNWIAWWHHPGDETSSEDIASQLADTAVAGLLQDPARIGTGSGPRAAIALLRQDLDLLDKMLDTSDDR